MKTLSPRRVAAALIAPALAFGALATAPPAQAAPNSYAYSAARWLSDQLTHGLVHNPNYGGFDDYGLSLDIFFALDSLDTRATDAASIIDALKVDPTLYTTSEAYGDTGSQIAGATGKLATAVQLAGQDPTAFGGHDLIAELEGLVVADGDDIGHAKDRSPVYGGDYSNTITQALDVRALAVSGSILADETTAFLLKQQCGDGSFRVQASNVACTTGTGTVDGTAFAVQALEVAKTAGQTDLQDDIDDAVNWLISVQGANGSYSDDGAANTNSAGLAAATLKIAGKTGPAGNSAAWILGHQVTDAVAEDTALGNELGAIAFDKAALTTGKTGGITDSTRDQWIRATAQSAIGVNAVLPAATLTVTGPSVYVHGGSNVTVLVSGLAPGEHFSGSFSGGTPVLGTASSTGTGSLVVRTATTTANRTLTVKGSRAARTGSTVVKILGAKTLRPTVRYSSIKRYRTQTVSVSGLAPYEPVAVGYGGKAIKRSKASSTGTYSYSFSVGGSTGTKTVSIRGAFSDRRGVKTFTVT